jgi:ABC-type multidrug transport system fused ATPase/permease subunit
MWGDYGYMEEGKLGKPYNLGLLRRLARYARPCRGIIILALAVSLLGTAADLAVPYLTKTAIDRYIIAAWHRLPAPGVLPARAGEALAKASRGMVTTGDGTRFVSQAELSRLGPDTRAELEKRGVFKGWHYRVDVPKEGESARRIRDVIARIKGKNVYMEDTFALIPRAALDALPRQERALLRAPQLQGALHTGLLLLGLVLAAFCLGYSQYNLLERAGQTIMSDIRNTLFAHLQRQSLAFHHKNPVGRLVTRVTNDVENLNELFKSVIVTVFGDIFLLSGITAAMLWLDWRLSLACLALAPPVVLGTALLSAKARDAFRDLRTTISQINTHLQERLSGMRAVQLLSAEPHQMALFSKTNDENLRAGLRQIAVFAVFLPMVELFSYIGIALLIWRGGLMARDGQVTLGTLVAFVSYTGMFFRPMRDIAEKWNIMQSAMASMERIFEYLDQDHSLPEPEHPRTPDKAAGHLVAKDLWFSYNSKEPALRGVSFEAPPGGMYAFVGRTGAGKTTLVHLVERFYDPDQGAVLLDGVDLRDWPSKELRKHLGLVLQDVFLFAATVRENVTLGADSVDEAALARALEESGAAGFAGRLPLGLDTVLSEGGANLSAGERQLLSFARALYHDPRVLILDEATSSVDPETERLIQGAVLSMSRRRTLLVVAHRLSTVERADRIIVLSGGRVEEEGTHGELMERRGMYWRLRKSGGLAEEG